MKTFSLKHICNAVVKQIFLCGNKYTFIYLLYYPKKVWECPDGFPYHPGDRGQGKEQEAW
jgi:hypothetical protein